MDDTRENPATCGYTVEALSSINLEGLTERQLRDLSDNLNQHIANVRKALDKVEHFYLQRSLGIYEGRCLQKATGEIYLIRRITRASHPVHGEVTRVAMLEMRYNGKRMVLEGQTIVYGNQIVRYRVLHREHAEELVIRKYMELEQYKDRYNGKKETKKMDR